MDIEAECRDLVEQCIAMGSDSIRENALAKRLRATKSDFRVSLLLYMYSHAWSCANRIALRVIRDRREALRIVETQLPGCDVDGVRNILRFALAKIGLRRLVAVINRCRYTDPKLIDKCMYWLRALVPVRDQHLLSSLRH